MTANQWLRGLPYVVSMLRIWDCRAASTSIRSPRWLKQIPKTRHSHNAGPAARADGGRAASMRPRLASRAIVEEDLGDLVGVVEGGEVAGLAEGDVVRSGEEGLVRGPVRRP